MLGRVDHAPVELQLAGHAPATADRMLTEDHAVIRRFDGESAQVEELVVKCAQRQTVGLNARPANVMPLDVRCLKSGWCQPDAKVKPADTSPVLVSAHDPFEKARIAPPIQSLTGTTIIKLDHRTIELVDHTQLIRRTTSVVI